MTVSVSSFLSYELNSPKLPPRTTVWTRKFGTLRGMKKNLVGIGEYEKNIAAGISSLERVQRDRVRELFRAASGMAAVFAAVLPVFAAWCVSDGVQIHDAPALIAVTASVVSLAFTGKAQLAAVKKYQADCKTAKGVVKARRDELKDFIRNCDFVNELIDNV